MPSLDALGNLGEFVGAIGVVISLIYLTRQMQMNTNSVRAASFNSMSENSIRLLEHAFRDSEFANFLVRAEADPSSLTRSECLRWDSYMTAAFRHFGNLVYQRRVGALDEGMWLSYERTLEKHLRVPSWAAWYLKNSELFSDSLTRQVEKTLRVIEKEQGEG